MDREPTVIYSGTGQGKSSAALGLALQCVCNGGHAVIIQFLKGKGIDISEYARKLEPELKIFRFERSPGEFSELSGDKRDEEIQNIKNGLGYARKVMSTGECDVLVLDEVLGVLDMGVITSSELEALIDMKPDRTKLVLTGTVLTDEIAAKADNITMLSNVKF
ncbi:MAG: cob(I)yrinic acid a,c-diamide adenosyltransferase [Lachnospiraceae bacterium]|nr:cob(I)yrinic acid a,c-diamide adenosyltransferase [Lachnospiraceae bacterium]